MMTEEQRIQQEIDRRFNAESETETVVPTKNPSRETWQSANPGGDYDEAMKGRAASSTNVAAGDVDPYEALAAAEKAAKEQEEKNKSSIPGLDFAKSAYGSLHDDVKPYISGAAGYVGGKALRSVLPQDKVYGTPEYRDEQARYRSLQESEKPTIARANNAFDTASNAEEQHMARSSVLGQQRAMAEQQHSNSLRELEQAQAAHANSQASSLEDELAQRSKAAGSTPAAIKASDVELKRLPIGGEASEKYAIKFGANPLEALEVPSMQDMQKTNIPNQSAAFEKIQRVGSGFQAVAESPLLIGIEGQQAVREREASRVNTENQHQSKESLERKRLETELVRQKAEAKVRLENAQEAARHSAKALANAAKAHDTHMATIPVSPAQKADLDSSREAAFDLQDRIKKGAPSVLARIGTKIAPRFIPGVGSAFAEIEAEAALEDWKQKNYGRAAVHGLGSAGALAQATGVPWLMGAGDIAQIPAAGLALYDMATEPKKQK